MMDRTAATGPAILVVEDEAIIRMMLVDELEDAGYFVLEAENADDAVCQLLQWPDLRLVVTDVRMPGSIDGIGLARWMKEHRPDVPIIITSGFSTPPDVGAINPAICRIVAKPYLPRDAASWLAGIGLSGGTAAINLQ